MAYLFEDNEPILNAKTQKKFKLGVNTTFKNKKWKKTKV
jgi:hypothetical protein